MNEEQKRVSIIVVIILFCIVMTIINAIQNRKSLVDFCKSNGYDGVKVESGSLKTEFRCYKKVSVGIGYDYEYSEYIEPNEEEAKDDS